MPLPSSLPRLPCSTHHSCLKRPLTSCLLLALLVLLTLAQATPPQPQPKKAPKVGYGYRLTSLEETSDGLVGYLHLKQPTEIYGPDIPRLRLFVKHETDSRLRVHITDAENPRWEVPYNLLPRQQPPTPVTTASPSSSDTTPPLSSSLEYSGSDLVFSYTTDPFGFAVRRKSDNQPLFNTTPETASIYGPMVFKDQYLELTTSLPSSAALYGLGENTQPGGIRIKPNDPYTLYTTDISAINLNADLYGSHPVYMDVRGIGGESSSQAHGVLLLNSNGMDVFYSGESLTYKVIGGVFDLYFFSGPTPLQVIDQYTQLIGRPAAMPYWALGFHQCRWGYRNLSVVEAVVEGYAKARIPLDVIWNDDDHMDAAKDFTLDPVAYPQPKLRAFLDKIHSRGMKYVVLIDPGIAVNHTYGVFQRGMAGDVFIKYEGTPYLAQVWPGPVYFPDYLNPKGVEWWVDEIRRFHEMVPVNGLWIDMNEVSNFCTGKCELPTTHLCPDPKSKTPWVCCLDCKNITKTRWDEPPYKINASGILAPIGTKTIATSAEHYNGVKEYDAHSLYGFSQAIATHKALEPVLKPQRPFILTRSTFVGSGAYGAHWTGDNKGTWNDLKYSISTMLNFGIFGMPMVGSDICGFYPSPTEELCNRWIQLGAFYPFSRDHANFASPRQELYVWDTVAESARNALGMRYRLLPYLYTLSYRAHTSGAPIARPVFFSFPNFVQGYELSTQFLLGSSVMVSPVLKKSSTVVKVLFPPGTWYNLFDSSKAVVVKPGDEARYITLHAPWNQINVHVYQGTVLPMQRGGMISKDAKTTPFTLVVAFPLSVDEAEASGEVFADDDERPGMELEDGKATYVQFRAKMTEGNMVKVWSDVEMGAYASKKGFVVEKVRLLGLDVEGTSAAGLAVEVGGDLVADVSGVQITTTAPSAAVHIEKLEGDIQRRSTVVEIGGLELPLGKSFSLTWKFAVKGR